MAIDNLNRARARFVYEGARLAAIAAGAPIVPEPYDDREEAFREQFEKVIERQMGSERSSNAETLHESWVDAYRKMGWVYGPTRDKQTKTHPDMVPYDELGHLERDKDAVFVALCEIARKWVHLPGDDCTDKQELESALSAARAEVAEEKMQAAKWQIDHGLLRDECRGLEATRDELRAEVERLRADLEVAESRKSDVIQRLSRVEAAAKAWAYAGDDVDSEDPQLGVARAILSGIGPGGKKVKP